MPDSSSNENSFLKVFIPGVVLGLLVGLAIGAFVPPFLDRQGGVDMHVSDRGAVRTTPSERDARPNEVPPGENETTPANPQTPATGVKSPVKPEVKPDAKPEETPSTTPKSSEIKPTVPPTH